MYPNLRVQIWKAGLRQNKLARLLRIDETLVSRIVNGYREPSPELRRKISAILGSDENWLFQVEHEAADDIESAASISGE